MSLSSDISTTSTALSDIKTAIIAKGVTPSGNITTYANAISQISGSSGKYQLLDRVKDDSNNEIGSVVGFHYDANNTEYAVVCLDAAYRLGNQSSGVADGTGTITDLPGYDSNAVFSAEETATFNCDKILAQCTTSGWTSPALTHCRSLTFTIAGDIYAGQLPTLMELIKILEWRTEINTADPTASTYSSLVVSTTLSYWSSTQYPLYGGEWYVSYKGEVRNNLRNSLGSAIIPILEIPNANS